MSKGTKKSKISDISRTPPTRDEYEALADALETGNHQPITAAILGAVLVEHQLDIVLQDRLKCGDDHWKELTSEIGPLHNFHTKIVMGLVLRLYKEDFRFNLNIVRNIRNQFAHSKKLVNFGNELIEKEILKAKQIPGERRNFKYVNANTFGTQYAYISLCMLLTASLLRKQTETLQAKSRRLRKQSSLMRGLIKVLAPPIDADKLPHLSSLVTPKADPSPLAQVLARAQIAAEAQKGDDNKGNR